MTTFTQRLLLFIVLLSAAGLGIALYSQHVMGMRPCAWCVFQRLVLIVIGLVALAGVLWPGRGRLVTTGVTAVTAALGAGGIVAAWYQYSVAAAMFSCDQTFADRFMTGLGLDASIPWLFGIYATCMDARADLLGIEYALWALALFVILTFLSLASLFAALRKHP